MILVLAGTRDGRQLAAKLAETGYEVMVSVVSQYGKELSADPKLLVNAGPLDREGLEQLVRRRVVRAIVDASHPYAVNVSANAIAAAEAGGVCYLRYERPNAPLPDYDKLIQASDSRQAAKLAAEWGPVIFLTVGSRNLDIFRQEPLLAGCRLVARVLPEASVIAQCAALGFSPGDIVAIQGPFSHTLNTALYKEYGATVVVTKNSGEIGGSHTKFTAAIELGLPIVVIDRPAIHYPAIVSDMDIAVARIKEVLR